MTGKKNPIFGIDVSNWNEGLDFKAAVAEGYEFCVVLSSEGPYPDGNNHLNTLYTEQIKAASDAGMVVGSYHYIVEAPVKPQVDLFLKTTGGTSGKILMIDYEAYNSPYGYLSPTMATLTTFVEELKKRVPDHPIVVYSGKGYWESPPANGPVTGLGVVTWDANYPYENDPRPGPELYKEVWNWEGAWGKRWGDQEPMFWQFSGSTPVDGLSEVDVNAFRGTKEELVALTGSGKGEGGKKMIKAVDLVEACRLLRGIFYRVWYDGDSIPMWLDDGYTNVPPVSHMQKVGVECSDLLSWGLEYCGGDAIGGTGDFSDALVDWDYFDSSTPGEAGAIAVTPYSGPALSQQGHVLLFTGEHSTIQALYSDGVTEKYSDSETAGFLYLQYYGKLPGVDYSGGGNSGGDPSQFVKAPRWIAISKDGYLVAEGADYTRGWLDSGFKKGDWSFHGPKETG